MSGSGAATRAEAVEAVLKRLNDSYIFPEVAAQMEKAIRARMQRGEYNRITGSKILTQTLTTHLREVSQDGHLSVTYSYESVRGARLNSSVRLLRIKEGNNVKVTNG